VKRQRQSLHSVKLNASVSLVLMEIQSLKLLRA
jgi:hypothetical protein